MRVAPVGLAWPGDPFPYACQVAALTHGHPTGWLAAGCLARIIRELLNGTALEDAVERTLPELARFPRHEETLQALERAEAYAAMGAGLPEEVRTPFRAAMKKRYLPSGDGDGRMAPPGPPRNRSVSPVSRSTRKIE